jgi:hypothetical protein
VADLVASFLQQAKACTIPSGTASQEVMPPENVTNTDFTDGSPG